MLIHKTMKMPTSCLSCWISPTCEVWVAEKKKYKGYDNRLENCPLEEMKHGHWITWFENKDVRQAKCSECGMMFTLGKGRDIHYCGNCGAKMDAIGENDV